MKETFNRRTILKSGAGLGAGLLAATYSGPSLAQEKQLTFSVWGGDSEIAGYKDVIAKYEAANPGVKIKLDVMPFAQFYQQVDTRLAGRSCPDIFRVTYQQIGRYATNKARPSTSPSISRRTSARALPRLSGARSTSKACPLRCHITQILSRCSTMPTFWKRRAFRLYQPRSSLELGSVHRQCQREKLKAQGGASYPFAMSWQNGAVHRWMFYLYQHGGRLLNEDLTASRITEKAGVETIGWTQSWFTEGLVPPSTSVKSAGEGAEPLCQWYNRDDAQWKLADPRLVEKQQMKAKWGVATCT